MLLSETENVESLKLTELSFRTLEETSEKAIKRKYVFSYSPEWDEWQFTKCIVSESENSIPREWTTVKEISWGEGNVGERVPSLVKRQLADIIGESEVEKFEP